MALFFATAYETGDRAKRIANTDDGRQLNAERNGYEKSNIRN